MLSSVRAWIALQCRIGRELRKFNSLSILLKIYALNAIGRQKVVPVYLFGRRLHVRTATPDLYVATETLGSEFDALSDLPFSDSSLFIIDAGGYIGTASIALKSLFPDSVIVCLEPSSENFALLKRNTEGIKSIHPINAALVNEGMPNELYLAESSTGPWGFEVIETASATTEPIQTTTVAKIMQDFEVSRVHICKMDIEGGEYALLQNPEVWLDCVDALAIELHERKRSGIELLFRRATAARLNLRLPGEKILSLSHEYLSGLLLGGKR